MNKKYIDRRTDQERNELAAVIKKFKGGASKRDVLRFFSRPMRLHWS